MNIVNVQYNAPSIIFTQENMSRGKIITTNRNLYRYMGVGDQIRSKTNRLNNCKNVCQYIRNDHAVVFFLSEGVWGLHPLKNVTMPDVESIPEPMVALLQDGTS